MSQLKSGRALANIQYNSILASDQATSSEDESPGILHEEHDDARTALGVSIGREQARLALPNTPAAEKAAAIEKAGDYFQSLDGSALTVPESPPVGVEDDEDQLPTTPQTTRPRSSRPATPIKPPSPWRAGPKQFETPTAESDRSTRTRSILRDGFSFGRRRASSGPETQHKSMFSSFPSFPSIPKGFSVAHALSSFRDGDRSDDAWSLQRSRSRSMSKRRSTVGGTRPAQLQQNAGVASTFAETISSSQSRTTLVPDSDEEEKLATIGELPENLPLRHTRSRPAVLRRSTSDSSLVTRRTMSIASSLGDDSRFENVSEQVNSRFKAIKDSFADSRITLPSMPSITNFNASKFAPDFFNRERCGSWASKTPCSNQNSSSHQLHPVDPMTRQPYTSAKAAVMDAPMDKFKNEHPHFNRALDNLEGDVVVMGGYRGSILRSAEPPHRQLWVPIKVGLNIRKVDLEVGLGEDDDERATEKVIPGGMLTHIGPVDISRRLLKRLRSCQNARTGKLRVHEYGYDWRLSPAHLSRELSQFMKTLPCNQPGVPKDKRGATVIAHSLGGLITRHAVNREPELFAGIVYAGVPKTCVNILGPLRNGDEVLLSSRVLTAQVNFTIRTSFALLPLSGRCFIDKNTKEEYPVDFFDPQTWIDYRLSPCIARPLPPLAPPPKPTGITSYVSNTMATAWDNLPIPGRKSSKASSDISAMKTGVSGGLAAPESLDTKPQSSEVATANGNINNGAAVQPDSVRTAVTIPYDQALHYLTRTLKSVKKFKLELAHVPMYQERNEYPPVSVIYGKSTPTVIGAKVNGRQGIKHADAYDELAFASGDGVVLARAAMLPEGYVVARGGVVSSERGHVTLLGDLEAVGRCLNAVAAERRKGVGLGREL
ncbi:hypothetical protein AC578_8553 [Pseudocercospora eumusae]|uniref:Uncharacterized protein n=1 Tax=Pseudocercospora eumusae TaxID=321146 RepID=A0A139HW29_9PEZI|nr:hypothetical protein AC578_8553 [Pseudocercospora eumusae]